MRERIIEFFRSQSISFLFFLIGAAAGFVFAIVAYFIFASKKRKVRKGVTPVATEEIASTAADDYDAARTGMDFKGFTIAYGAYRVFAGKIDEKDPKKLTLAKIAEVVCSYTDKPAREPEHVGFFGKIKGKLLKVGASAALKPTIVPVVDDAVKEALERLISDFNLLFSHNLRGGTYGLKYLASADEEDAV